MLSIATGRGRGAHNQRLFNNLPVPRFEFFIPTHILPHLLVTRHIMSVSGNWACQRQAEDQIRPSDRGPHMLRKEGPRNNTDPVCRRPGTAALLGRIWCREIVSLSDLLILVENPKGSQLRFSRTGSDEVSPRHGDVS